MSLDLGFFFGVVVFLFNNLIIVYFDCVVNI